MSFDGGIRRDSWRTFRRGGIKIKGDYMFGSSYVLYIWKCWNRINWLIIRNIGKPSHKPSGTKTYHSSNTNFSPSSKPADAPTGKTKKTNSSNKHMGTYTVIQQIRKGTVERSRQVFLLPFRRKLLQNCQTVQRTLPKPSQRSNQKRRLDPRIR